MVRPRNVAYLVGLSRGCEYPAHLAIDDTITRHKEFFAFLSNALIDSGNQVYIISYRQGQREVEADLAAYGISFTEVVLPTSEELREGFYERIATACRRLGVPLGPRALPARRRAPGRAGR